MSKLSYVGGALVAVFVGVSALVGFSTPAYAVDGNVKAETKQVPSEKKSNDYTYKATAGASYTQLVRKAVQTYGLQNKVNLGNVRIVYIETMMTQAAGSPILDLGQSVTIKNGDVKTWVAKAQKLSAADVAAWQTYVPYIDFDTRSIGE